MEEVGVHIAARGEVSDFRHELFLLDREVRHGRAGGASR
jgi:hypothetical protein